MYLDTFFCPMSSDMSSDMFQKYVNICSKMYLDTFFWPNRALGCGLDLCFNSWEGHPQCQA